MNSPEHISPASLFAQMSSLAYERNEEFRRGAQDSCKLSIETEIDAESTAIDNLGNIVPLLNKKSVSFRAERTDAPVRRNKVPLPTAFDIVYADQVHLNSLPEAVAPHLGQDVLDEYIVCNPGDIQRIHGVTYRIENDGGDIDITRNVTYTLQGLYGPIYEIGEIDESPDSVQWVPVAHEQKSLRIERRVIPEQVEDQLEQLPYDATFDDFRDGLSNSSFYNELVALREQEATLCISALLRCLTHGRRIPRFDEILDLPK